MTTVRLVVSLLVSIALDSHLVAFIKLNHAMAGIYMYLRLHGQESVPLISTCNNLSWETVFTAGFELDVLRRKRPYRWTIWVSSLQHTWAHHHLKERSYTLGPATLAYFPSFASSSMLTDPGLIVRYGLRKAVQSRTLLTSAFL